MSKQEKFLLRVQKGSLIPADEHTRERMREKGYALDDVLTASLSKARNPAFNRLMHAFGKLCAENIEAFEGLSAHAVLKRIQWEANVGCETMIAEVPNYGAVEVRWPKSLSFASMDDGEAKEVYSAMCRHVSKQYWPELSEEQIQELVELMPEAA